MKEIKFSLPSFSHCNHVYGGLYMGGSPPVGYEVQKHFDSLVLMAREYQPDPFCFGDLEVINAPIEDNVITTDQIMVAFKTAMVVRNRIESGKKILVTCFAGLNRSGLVCAIALCALKERMKPEESIKKVRSARGEGALNNTFFVELVEKYCKNRLDRGNGTS